MKQNTPPSRTPWMLPFPRSIKEIFFFPLQIALILYYNGKSATQERKVEEARGEVLEKTWKLIQQGDMSSHPQFSKIVRTYYEAEGKLLILSQNNTSLFTLARSLVLQAQTHRGLPIPVIFNLSSWEPPMDQWLVEQLERIYRVPHKLAQSWTGQIVALFHGFDDLDEETRRACVQAINTYQHCVVVSLTRDTYFSFTGNDNEKYFQALYSFIE